MRLFSTLLLLLTLGLTARAQPATAPAVVSLSFDLPGGLVVLRGLTVNGQTGDFVLDTGCAYGLVVEQAAFAGQLRPATTRTLGATGQAAQYQVPGVSFQFGAAHYSGLAAVATSLAAIRPAVGPRLLGLIGTGLLRDYEVVLDYARRRLSCYPLRGPRRPPLPYVRADSLRFALIDNWPVVTGTIGRVPVRLLLDTGATSNNLDLAFSQALPAATRPRLLSRERLTGVSGGQSAQRAILPVLHLGATDWRELPCVVTALAQPTGKALPYQGILGFPFLSQDVVVSFHYGRRQLYALKPR